LLRRSLGKVVLGIRRIRSSHVGPVTVKRKRFPVWRPGRSGLSWESERVHLVDDFGLAVHHKREGRYVSVISSSLEVRRRRRTYNDDGEEPRCSTLMSSPVTTLI
jgi:hypothetical protein